MKGVFKAEIMQEIEKMGHEVGYHYEVLDKAKGNFDIIGEPYLSIDFDRVAYFTDTGRSLDAERYRVKDNVDSNLKNKNKAVKHTEDIIKSKKYICKRDILKMGKDENGRSQVILWVLG